MNDSAQMITIESTTAAGTLEGGLSRGAARNLRIAGVLGFAGLTGIAAQIAIPVQPYGIPLTLQTLAVSMCALTLGARLGSLSMLVYVVLGAVGLPMFAEGSGGYSHVFGQTGGYLAGFIIAQPLIALIARTRFSGVGSRFGAPGGPIAVCAAVIAGHAVVFLLGVTWLKLARDFSGTGGIEWADAWFFGCVVFLPGMFAKAGLAAIVGSWLVERGRKIGC